MKSNNERSTPHGINRYPTLHNCSNGNPDTIKVRKLMKKLPRGIWYEESRKRYRVKLYRNNIPYLGGYFSTLKAALAKHAELKAKLKAIPKLRKGQRAPKTLFGGSMGELISSSKQENDPNINLKP